MDDMLGTYERDDVLEKLDCPASSLARSGALPVLLVRPSLPLLPSIPNVGTHTPSLERLDMARSFKYPSEECSGAG